MQHAWAARSPPDGSRASRLLAREHRIQQPNPRRRNTMKELDRKDTPEVGGGSVGTTAVPGGPIIAPFPPPDYPQYPGTPVLEPVTGTQKY